MEKNPFANAGDTRDVGSIPGLKRSPRVGNGNPLQYSGKFHGQRSLVGYSPWARKKLGTKSTHPQARQLTILILYYIYIVLMISKYFHIYVLIRSPLLICIVFNPHFMGEEIEAERIYLAWP